MRDGVLSAKDLRYATRQAGSWLLLTVDSAGDVGNGPSLAVDAQGAPHITYRATDSKQLKYARW